MLVLLAAAILSPGPSNAISEQAERKVISSAAKEAFLSSNFAELERMSLAYRTEKSRTSSGLWKLTLFYLGIDQAIWAASKEGTQALEKLETVTNKWAVQYPDSPAAHIAYSMALITHGWTFRGGGYASSVRPESWAPFRRYIAMARKNLETHKAVASRDPSWYETMLTIARAEAWDADQFDSLLNEALKREPLFYQTYFSALRYLLPQWHGDVRAIETFAQDAARRTSEVEGRGMYARIYWYASQAEFRNNLFDGTLVFWPRMKAGFEDVIAKYPDDWNLSNYAKFACLAKDKPKTKELLARLGSSVVLEAWEPATLLQKCIAWSSQG
jgi:hypothetical protein